MTLIKLDKMDELMFLVQEDGEFFKKRWYRMAEKKYACKDYEHCKPIDEAKGDSTASNSNSCRYRTNVAAIGK